jgi:hypothetical protein
MTRRRLILIAVATVTLLGLAWWQSHDRLSPEEERLVGTWRHCNPESGEWSVMILTAERQFTCVPLGSPSTRIPPHARWWVRDGQLVVDLETDPIRRSLRPLAGQIGVVVADVAVFPLASVTTNEMVITHARGPRRTWTRAPAD